MTQCAVAVSCYRLFVSFSLRRNLFLLEFKSIFVVAWLSPNSSVLCNASDCGLCPVLPPFSKHKATSRRTLSSVQRLQTIDEIPISYAKRQQSFLIKGCAFYCETFDIRDRHRHLTFHSPCIDSCCKFLINFGGFPLMQFETFGIEINVACARMAHEECFLIADRTSIPKRFLRSRALEKKLDTFE